MSVIMVVENNIYHGAYASCLTLSIKRLEE